MIGPALVPSPLPTSRLENLIGQRFGRLVVRGFYKRDHKGIPLWVCDCDCGAEVVGRSGNLKRGSQQSCGCLTRFVNRVLNTVHGHGAPKARSLEYRSWSAIRDRCLSKRNHGYPEYGGRGISICARWKAGEAGKSGFECFLEDMGARPSKRHSIDRYPDNDGNYEPGNCRWATPKEQQRNRRSTVFIVIGGEKHSLADLCEAYSLPYGVAYNRWKKGEAPSQIFRPIQRRAA